MYPLQIYLLVFCIKWNIAAQLIPNLFCMTMEIFLLLLSLLLLVFVVCLSAADIVICNCVMHKFYHYTPLGYMWWRYIGIWIGMVARCRHWPHGYGISVPMQIYRRHSGIGSAPVPQFFFPWTLCMHFLRLHHMIGSRQTINAIWFTSALPMWYAYFTWQKYHISMSYFPPHAHLFCTFIGFGVYVSMLSPEIINIHNTYNIIYAMHI